MLLSIVSEDIENSSELVKLLELLRQEYPKILIVCQIQPELWREYLEILNFQHILLSSKKGPKKRFPYISGWSFLTPTSKSSRKTP